MTRPGTAGAATDALGRSAWIGLFDDAAVFPPGNAALSDAITAHRRYRTSAMGDLVGPLVVPDQALPALDPLLGDGPPPRIAVTVPGGPEMLDTVFAAAAALPVALAAVEVAVPEPLPPRAVLTALDRSRIPTGTQVFVEIPRDDRRAAVLSALAGRYRAKFRTGGVRAQLYPDEVELAASVAAAVAAGVAFKATAGLHHALRNTDPATGFEQHGFVNLLLATATAAEGGGPAAVAAALALRDAAAVTRGVRALGDDGVAAARSLFRSFGTCSITEPLAELVRLGLLEPGADGSTP